MKHIIKKVPLQHCDRLSSLYNAKVFLQREDLQKTRSFKIRGAANKIFSLTDKQKNYGLVTCSAGNHAQGVAYLCNKLDINGTIFIPTCTPLQKKNRILTIGKNRITLKMIGNNFDDALTFANKYTLENNLTFVHPFDDNKVIEGQGTILEDIYKKIEPDYIIATIGGGGLCSGLCLVRNKKKKLTKIVGVQTQGCPSMYNSLMQNKICKLEKFDTFSEGSSVSSPGKLTFEICKSNLTDVLLVNNNHLSQTIVDLYQNNGIITEPAGALSVAGLELIKETIFNKTIVCIISGGNNDIMRYNEIIEKSLIHRGLMHYFIVQFPQIPGALRIFVTDILGKNDDITRFEYMKKSNKSYGSVLIGIQLQDPNDIENILKNLDMCNYKYTKITQDDTLYSLLI